MQPDDSHKETAMKREIIEKRLKELEKAIEQSIANLNMLMGGKEECMYWLKQLDAPAPEPEGMPLHEVKELLGADSVSVEKAG